MSNLILEVRRLDVHYGAVHAVKCSSFEIYQGEMLFLIGPSGSGKTSTLRCVAGFEKPSRGEILLNGKNIVALEPGMRDVSMVFQGFTCFPGLSPIDNIGLPLRIMGLRKADIYRRVEKLAAFFHIEHLLRAKTESLSDGDRQRVSIARAIIKQPSLILLDEPLTFLDPMLRTQLGRELRELQRSFNFTGFYVTHDQKEAMTLGDRIAIMDEGVIQQIDSPQVVYDKPVNTFVATFVGSPSMNLIHGVVRGLTVAISGLEGELPIKNRDGFSGDVLVGIRPHQVEIGVTKSEIAEQMLQIEVIMEYVQWLGSVAFVHCRTRDGASFVGRSLDQNALSLSPGSNMYANFDPLMCHLFDGKNSSRVEMSF